MRGLRLKKSIILGGVVSLLLLSFAFLLFYTLFISQEQSSVTEITPRIWSLLRFTLYQAFLSTLLSMVVGVLLAWSLAHQSNFRGRSILVAIFSSSLVLPTLITLFVVLSSNFKTNLTNLKTSSLSIPWSEPKIVRYFQVSIIALFALFFTLPLVDGVGADFKKIVSSELFQNSLITSISLATISSILTVIFALLLSDSRRNFTLKSRLEGYRFAKLFNLIISFSGNLYLAIPSLIMGLGFFLLSQRFEAPMILWSIVALITANVLMSLPFALANISPIMQKTAQRYDKLAFSLNLSSTQRWIYCELPYLKSSLGYIFALSFCFSLGDLGIIALFGSDEFSTLPWYLYQLMGSYHTTDASGVALILLGITLGVFILFGSISKRQSKL